MERAGLLTQVSHVIPESFGVTSSVRDGWVTLKGTVDWQYERTAADGAIRYFTGITGVNNLITVAPRAMPSDVKEHIRAALTRSAETDAKQITVDSVPGGAVTLRGTIHSWAEREEVNRAAWATPGVRQVRDELTYAA